MKGRIELAKEKLRDERWSLTDVAASPTKVTSRDVRSRRSGYRRQLKYQTQAATRDRRSADVVRASLRGLLGPFLPFQKFSE